MIFYLFFTSTTCFQVSTLGCACTPQQCSRNSDLISRRLTSFIFLKQYFYSARFCDHKQHESFERQPIDDRLRRRRRCASVGVERRIAGTAPPRAQELRLLGRTGEELPGKLRRIRHKTQQILQAGYKLQVGRRKSRRFDV